ncbi:MAG: PAS domain S-box protein [Nitrosomonadales bacterium]
MKLRKLAEKKLNGQVADPSGRTAQELLHELQVHQIELEMQNETLRQNQIQLEESRDRYLDLYDFAPVAYLTINAAGMIVEINHTGAQLLGLERKKILKRRLSNFLSPEDSDRWHRCFIHTLNTISACHGEFCFQRHEGALFYAGIDGICIDGLEKSVRITLTDITERRNAELALRANDIKLRGLFDLSPLGIALTDINGKYIEFNQSFIDITGYSKEALMQLDYWALTPESYADQEASQLAALQLTGRYGPYEKEYRRRDGSRVPLRLNGMLTTGADGQTYIWSIVEDISERLQTEAALRRSEARFRQMAEAVDEVFWLMSPDGKTLQYINPAFEKIWGISCEQVYADPDQCALMAHPDDRARVEQAASQLLLGINYDLEYRIIRPDGELRWVKDRGYAIRDTAGHVINTAGVASDITQRKLTEINLNIADEKLHHSAQLLEAIVEHIPAMVFVKRASDLTFELFNRAGETLLGYDRSVLLGRSDADFWPREQAEGFIAADRQVLNSRELKEIAREQITIASGDVRDLHTWKIALRDNAGVATHLLGISVDITERERAANRLSESEEKMRAIVDGALDGIVLLDPDSLRFTSANPAFCKMTGYSQQVMDQLSVRDIHRAEDLPWVAEQLVRHVKGEQVISTDIPVKRQDGQVVFVDIKSAPVVLGGKLYLVGIFRDITERRLADAQLKMSARRHQILFEHSRDALMTLSVPALDFTSANAATLSLFAANSLDEFIALKPWDVSPEHQPDGTLSSDKARQWMQRALESGLCSFEWQHRRLDGTLFTADVLLTRMQLGEELILQATVRDITLARLREQELKEYQQLLRDLAAQGAALREAELKHIAREVHDELGQLLTALRMDISLVRIQFANHNPLLMPKVQDMLRLVDKAIQGARDVTSNLHPPALDLGIVAAAIWLKDELMSRSEINCTLEVINDPPEIEDTVTLTLFRIVQESITNIMRHANALEVRITIDCDQEHIYIEIADNGAGFDVNLLPSKKSFGLMGMKERALAVSGKVNIRSRKLST